MYLMPCFKKDIERIMTRKGRNLYRCFGFASVCSIMIKAVGMAVSLVFAAADMV